MQWGAATQGTFYAPRITLRGRTKTRVDMSGKSGLHFWDASIFHLEYLSYFELYMIRILYFSTARPSVSKEAVNQIAAKAQVKNRELGITGALAYNGRNFCQALEGEEAKVRDLIEKIRADERHSGFKILDEKQISERYFPEWTMELVSELDFSVVINSM
ncbi:BLUF domain-containing protein [Sulfitobacter sp.]|uniref:BLUF domain-containing protein n=2 Tax=Sulfitobacter TaxID=60136 RepID=UPI0039E2E437